MANQRAVMWLGKYNIQVVVGGFKSNYSQR